MTSRPAATANCRRARVGHPRRQVQDRLPREVELRRQADFVGVRDAEALADVVEACRRRSASPTSAPSCASCRAAGRARSSTRRSATRAQEDAAPAEFDEVHVFRRRRRAAGSAARRAARRRGARAPRRPRHRHLVRLAGSVSVVACRSGRALSSASVDFEDVERAGQVRGGIARLRRAIGAVARTRSSPRAAAVAAMRERQLGEKARARDRGAARPPSRSRLRVCGRRRRRMRPAARRRARDPRGDRC